MTVRDWESIHFSVDVWELWELDVRAREANSHRRIITSNEGRANDAGGFTELLVSFSHSLRSS